MRAILLLNLILAFATFSTFVCADDVVKLPVDTIPAGLNILVTTAPVAGSKAGDPIIIQIPKNVAPPSTTTPPPIVVTRFENEPSNAATTTKPPTTIVPVIVEAVKPPGVESDNREGKFTQYMGPVCENLDKIPADHLFKLQQQFKTFVDKTNGKLAFCFLVHYGFEPNLNLVTKENLNTICDSKKLASSEKNSIAAFEKCASNNWEPSLDKELDRIISNRLNCMKTHQHDKSEAVLTHDEESRAFLNDVVTSMLDQNSGLPTNSDIKLVDLSAGSDPIVSQVNSSVPNVLSSGSLEVTKNLMNDPKTVVLLVDDASTKSTTTPQPDSSRSDIGIATSVTTKPFTIGSTLGNKILADLKMIEGTTTTPSPIVTIQVVSTTSEPKSSSTTTTTAKPEPSTIKGSTTLTTKAPLNKSTSETLNASLQEILARQEKQKKDFDDKLKAERDKALGQIEKDEAVTKKAIKALQIQRYNTKHNSDSRLHQIEHERQMAIDPIGHTIKHQQYTLSQLALQGFKL